jgi:glycosyltransferase involved in cell wall biosynthesis
MQAGYLVISSRRTGISRYVSCATRTIFRLLRDRPALVFAQSPSIFLAALAVTWGRLAGVRVVIDAHNAGVLPAEGRNRLLTWLATWSLKRAALVIVTTAAFAEIVRSRGGRPFVLMDPLPGEMFAAAERFAATGDGEPSIVCITTWAKDEPIEALLAVAPLLPESWRLKFTGRPPDRIRQMPLPKNVRLTGFLSDADYLKLVLGASCIVDLTTREDCLVCGAYEAIAARRPIVLSDTAALRNAFGEVAQFTRNDPQSIATAIKAAMQHGDVLAQQCRDFADRFVVAWRERKSILEQVLATPDSASG